jgi:hypothetical protein
MNLGAVYVLLELRVDMDKMPFDFGEISAPMETA